MILIDAGPLIALVDERDRLNRRALQDLGRLESHELFTCVPVLTEACFALSAPFQRARLNDLLERLDIQPRPTTSERELWGDVFAWLARYADHEPDFADAWLAVLSQQDRHLRLWTYDDEFRHIWRRLDGSRIPLLG